MSIGYQINRLIYEMKPCLFLVVCMLTNSFASAKILNLFSPKKINNFENIGSQENFFFTIPAENSADFALVFNGFIATSSSGINKGCPSVEAEAVVNRWGIPISNPLNTSNPQNTFLNPIVRVDNFTISSQNKSTVLKFSENSSIDQDFYAAAYLVTPEDDQIGGLSADCHYGVSLSVLTKTLHNTYVPPVNNFVASFNASDAVFLPKIERDFLKSIFKAHAFGYNISATKSPAVKWNINHYEDTGGTMFVKLTIAEQNFTQNLTVFSNLHWQQLNTETVDTFQLDASFNKSTSDIWYFPYPRDGTWILELGAKCNELSCSNDVKVYLNIGITPCIDECQSSKYQGNCESYQTNAIKFASCNCKAGWAGIGCTDGRKALTYAQQLTMTLLLTLSNIIFLPCTILAIKRKFYTEAAVYFFVAFFSSFYHACDEPGYVVLCIMKYDTLQYSDFLGSNCAFWFTIIAIAALPHNLESLFHVVGLLLISVGVQFNRFSVWVFVVPILVGLAILAIKWGRMCHSRKTCYPDRKIWLFSLVPGVLCAVVGLILYTFLETTQNYFYTHSLWHILMGTSILFLLPGKKREEDGFWSLPTSGSSISSSDCSANNHFMLNDNSNSYSSTDNNVPPVEGTTVNC